MRNWIDIIDESFDENEITIDLRDIRYRAEAMGAICDFGLDGDKITLDMLSLPLSMQGNGVGTDIMWSICGVADRYGARIEIEVASFAKFGNKEIGQIKLEEFYQKFGFEKTGTQSSEGYPVMIRTPLQN